MPLGLLLAETLLVAVPHALGVALPHCEREGVKLAETHAEPLELTVTEKVEEGVHDEECVPLGLPLADTLCDAVPHTLCVALPHCESDGVKLEDTHAEPLGLNVTEEEDDGVHDGECEPLGLLLIEPLLDAVTHALCVALPHSE